MKRKIAILLSAILATSTLITGCSLLGSDSDDEDDGTVEVTLQETKVKEYDNNSRFMGDKIKFSASTLEPGNFYIRHRDNTCEDLYFGEANFNQGDSPSNVDSVMWFKTDFNNIPTLFEGDSLIYYTNEEFEEEFVLTRFEDMGYSVGICGLEPTDSYRYTVSTDKDDKCSYPNSDADEILYLDTENAIFESIGSVELRYDPEEEERVKEAEEKGEKYVRKGIYVTRVGSIANLADGKKYDAILYSGTIENDIVMTCDVRILGFMEELKTVDYSFEPETNVLIINIPEEYKNGYYMVNGFGMFRYVNGTEYNEGTEFNEANPEEVIEIDADDLINEQENNLVNVTKQDSTEEETVIDEVSLVNESTQTFKVKEPGVVTIRVTFEFPELPEGYDIGAVDDPSAYVETPNGTRYRMAYKNGEMYLELDAVDSGTYKIIFDNLYGRKPSIEIG